jgi:hypothetical protein
MPDVTVRMTVPEEARPKFATNFLLQKASGAHLLSLFQVRMPVTLTQLDLQNLQSKGVDSAFLEQYVITENSLRQLRDLIEKHIRQAD